MQLEWSRHPIELADGISRLLESRQLLDVTLSAEGKQIKAHRIVLAAASEYFKVRTRDILVNGCSSYACEYTY